MTDIAFEARMSELKAQFLVMAAEERGRLLQAIPALNHPGNRDMVVTEIRAIAHRIAGVAGMFGFHDIGEAAELLENLTITPPADIESIRSKSAALSDALGSLVR